MNDVVGYAIAAVAGFSAHVIGAILFTAIHHRWLPKYRDLRRIFLSIYREMLGVTGVSFYTSRHNLNTLLGPLSTYLGEAERRIEYCGVQFYSLEDGGAEQALKTLVIEKHIEIRCYLLDPDSPLVSYYAQLLGRDAIFLKTQLVNAIARLVRCRASLPDDARQHFQVFTHNLLLPSSYFAFDVGIRGTRPKILMDHKLPSVNRSTSYGLEVANSNHPLFKAVNKSLDSVRKNSREVVVGTSSGNKQQ